MRKFLFPAIVLFSCCGFLSAGNLNLNIVYPKSGQSVWMVDSMFIFGSVEKGSRVFVNGSEVEAHKKGGWLGFVAVSPGKFVLDVRAEKNGKTDSAIVKVTLPSLPDYDYSKLTILENGAFPDRDIISCAGDKLTIVCKGTPFCNLYCVIEPVNDTVSLSETPPRYYYGSKNVFDKNASSEHIYPESMMIRGNYNRDYAIPGDAADSLSFSYLIFPPTPRQLTLMTEKLKNDSSSIAYRLAMQTGFGEYSASRSVRLYRENEYPVAELKDSISIIRTGPGKGYLCVNQPRGIRTRIIGKDGRWLKVRLSDYQIGWIIDTCATLLPPSSIVPHSYISRIQTIDYPDKISVTFNTIGKHPYRVEDNIEERTITVFIFGAESDTDWIRYDNRDKLINHAVWSQPEPGVYALKIYLNDDKIWGYDAYYVGDEFHFDIKKFPRTMWDISQFRFIIDPGHEPDAGAVGPTGLAEKTVNLAIAERLKTALEREGAEVVMTREGDSGISLYDRPKLAVREKADIFISIHNNALPDGINPFENNGTAVFYYHPHSAELAHAVHDAMASDLPLKDFGWYYGNLAVARPTQYPAILVECAFMMIPEQEAKLRTKKFQKQIANAIVQGIKAYIGGPDIDGWDK